MVKTVLGVSHQGLRDWIIQRLSALIIAVYSLGLVGYLIASSNLSFAEWHGLFAQNWVKVATLIFILAVLFHAWVGMWTILTDYVKPVFLRGTLEALIFLFLLACFIWGVLIIWSV